MLPRTTISIKMPSLKTDNKRQNIQNNKPSKRRKRGVILTVIGLEKIKEAQLKSEGENNWGAKYTYEKLSEIVDLDINTVKKILAAKEGVDKRSIENYFRGFKLQLDKEDYEKPNPNKRQDWGAAVCVDDFIGRTLELNVLENLLLKNKCRLITVLGMGGIGKTALSIRLAQKVQERFDCVVWRSFRDAPPLNEFLADSIEFLSNGQITEADLSERTTKRISCLIDCLRSQRCLIVLDNVESLLCENIAAGSYCEGYEEYGELFQRIGETDHKSCLLLTTREKPKEIASMEGEALPVFTFKLGGLEQKTGAEILRNKGLDSSEAELNKLVRHYNGNGLALKIVATTVRNLFGGNIEEFLREETVVFGDIRTLLDRQFERLTFLEREIIYWLAINREPTTLSELREDIVSTVSRSDLIEGLESLSRRSLLESSEASFTLQPVVMEYIINRFIEKICEEIATQKLSFFRYYSLIKATTKDYVRETQIRLILQPIMERLIANFQSQTNLERQLKQIIATQQERSPRERGYVAGNIINLFCQMQTDLTGYDFSNLCVWQADLRQVQLHNVNFQNSDLSKTLFAENFGGVMSVAFSPDGNLLAAGDTKGEIRLYRVADGQQLLLCQGHKNWIPCLAFSPDGSVLASSSSDHTVRLWDVNSGKCLKTLQEHNDEVWSIDFSPDGNLLASASDDHTIKLWNVNSGKCLKTFEGHSNDVHALVFNPNGQTLASGSADCIVSLWDINTGKRFKFFEGHDNAVRSLTYSPDGQTLVSSSEDRTVKLWDVNSGKCLKTFEGHCAVVLSVNFNSQGDLLVSSSSDQTVKLWDVNSGKCLRTFWAHSNWVFSVAFNPQGDLLASGSHDQTLKLWSVSTGQCLKTFQGYNNQTLSVIYSPDGQMLASGGHDQKVRLWDVKTGKTLKTFQGHQATIWSIAFSPDGKTLASSSEDQTIKLWDVKTGKTLKTFQGHQAAIWSIAFSLNGKMLASGALEPIIRLWDINTSKCIKILEDHESWAWSVAFSSDDKTLASTSPDGTLKLWNVNTGKCFKTLRKGTGWLQLIDFSLDGRIIATTSQDYTINLWNISTGECFKTLQGHTALLWSVVFSPDNKTLASASEDETTRIWDVETGECLKILRAKKPYERMNLTSVTGSTKATIETLKMLGTTDS